MRLFLGRLATLSFNAVVGGWATYAGAAGLLHYGITSDALSDLLPPALVTAFQIGYLAAGLLLLLGIGFGRRDLEGGGLLVVVASVIVRQVALIYLAGFPSAVVNALVLNALLVLGCIVRLRQLAHGYVLVKFESAEGRRR